MKNEFVLSKSDSICKTCGGIGTLSLLSGVVMCLLATGVCMPIGVLLFNLGVVMLTEVFMYLFEVSNLNIKFATAISVIGIALAIIGSFGLFATTIPTILCLAIIGVGDIMMLLQRYK